MKISAVITVPIKKPLNVEDFKAFSDSCNKIDILDTYESFPDKVVFNLAVTNIVSLEYFLRTVDFLLKGYV